MSWLAAVMLMSVRLGVAFGFAPPFNAYGLPAFVRMALVLALAMLVAGIAPYPAGLDALLSDPAQLLEAVGAEVLIGMMLGLGVHVALAAFAFAGRLLDVQVGFGIGSIFDPLTRTSANVLAALMSVLGVCLFFATDAHLALAGLIGRSTVDFPLGAQPAFDDPMRMLAAAGVMFSTGLALAAPVVLALLITDVLIGMASRNLPQVNVLVLGIPLKVLVGYGVLALSVSVSAWAPIVDTLFALAGNVLGAAR